jgi:oxaloacetate decarboxylase gamma subunit
MRLYREVCRLPELLREGAQLMLVGMGVVFVFLTLLVFAVKGMSRFAIAVAGRAELPDVPAPSGVQGNETELIAAVTSAVHAHRKSER